MAVLNLSVLTLVGSGKADGETSFYLRPLFLQQPVAMHGRYEEAVKLYKRDLGALFSGFRLEKANEDFLLWMTYKPEVRFRKSRLTIPMGKHSIIGAFSVVDFRAGGFTFVLLPGLHNYMCMAHYDDPSPADVDQTAANAIAGLFKKWKKDHGDAFDPTAYFAPRREYITTIETRVHFNEGGYAFEQRDENAFFMRMRVQTDFDGATELAQTGHDLNSRFPGELKRAHYREVLVTTLYERIFSPAHVPIVIVGPEGVGRHTLLEEVVYRYLNRHEQTGLNIQPKTFWHLDPVRVIAGMSVVGMWQKRFEAILQHLIHPEKWADKPDILVVDNPVALLRVGRYAGGNMVLADVLKPSLEKRQLPFVLIATPEEWSVVQEQDRRLSSLFQVLRIGEPSRNDMLLMILEKRKMLEETYQVAFQVQALDLMLNIHRNYLSHRALPGGVAKMMELLAVKHRWAAVDAPEVREAFQHSSGLAEVFLDDGRILQQDDLESALSGMLVGQTEAFQTLISTLHLVKAKLADKTKPVGSLLFAGPTGVGKTQAAKALCRILTGSENALLRFDMNEYGDAGAVQRLIGDFSQPEGRLTSVVRHNPFGVLLLDELEKAHPKVHDLLLQLLDDGRLTDGLGRTVDFSNLVVIMTSNLGAHSAMSAVGFAPDEEDIRTVYVRAVENFFRPEFVNRIDRIIAFRTLDEEQVYQIARLQLRELLQRDGFVRRTSILNVDPHALRWVAKRGYDAGMGGRALKRQIEKDLTELSADQLLDAPLDSPIILDIVLENNRLSPRIQVIGMTPPAPPGILPEIPAEANGREFLQKLLRKVETFRRRVKAAPQAPGSAVRISESDIDLYEMQEHIEKMRERIKTLLLSYRGNFLHHRPVSPLRLKISSPGLLDSNKEYLKEKMFRDDALQELHEAYRYGPPRFSPADTVFMELFLDMAILQLQVEGFEKGLKDKVEIRIASLVAGEGAEEVEILLACYEDYLHHAGFDFFTRRRAGVIELEGFGLYELFAAETGVHLFKTGFGNSIPVMVWVRRQEAQETSPPLDILRLYDKPKLLTDLRTGFVNEMKITPQELKLLLYGGAKATGRLA